MTLSQTCKAAIKAAIFLASKQETGENATIREISAGINESEHTIGKVLQTLARNEIINSIKGPSGGFYLTESQYKQPLINIVLAIEGKNALSKCGLGLAKCSSNHPCPIHQDYQKARDLIETMYGSKRISDMYKLIRNGKAFLTE